MARKLTCTVNGALAGKRTTDRKYTHCVTHEEFDEAAFRGFRERYWTSMQTARDGAFDHASQSRLTTYRYASVVSVAERMNAERVWGLGRSGYEIECRAKHDAATEAGVAEQTTRGPVVASWHSRRDLAEKAAAQAQSYYTWVKCCVRPVDGSQA